MKTHIDIDKGRRRLFRLWLFSCFGLFLLLIGMSIGGAIPSEHTQSVWEWFLPMVMPTLMLMVSVYVYAPPAHGKVDKVIYGAAFWLSVAYLLALFIPMIAHPFQPVPMIELALMSSLWLGPMQGLVASAIGVFFVKSGVAKDPGMMAHKSGS